MRTHILGFPISLFYPSKRLDSEDSLNKKTKLRTHSVHPVIAIFSMHFYRAIRSDYPTSVPYPPTYKWLNSCL